MLLSLNICVVVRFRILENRVMKETEFMAGVWRHMLILVAEIATARNRMRKSARSKQRSPVHQSR